MKTMKCVVERKETRNTHANGGHRKHNFAFTIDVRVENTKDVLKLLWYHQSLKPTEVHR